MSQQQDEGAPVVGDDSEFQDVPLDGSTEQLPPAPVAADSDGEEDDKTSNKDLDDDNEDTDDEADEKYSSNDDEGIISDEEVGSISSNAKVLPDPQKQRAIIKDLELSQPMEVGQTWYLIAIQWWRHWREWVQWDSRYTFHRSTPPGPIDNSPLLEPGTNIVARMKMDNFDYQLANEAMWNHLVEWYGGGPAIPRKVISYGIYTSSKSVEVYPQVLNFYFRDAPTKVFQENFSKSDNLDNVKKFLCNKFDLKPDEVRLWLVRDNIPHKYLKSLTDSVYSCNFYRDDKILIDKRNADGTWPKVTRPKRRDNKWGYRIEPTEVGLTGLQNLGNTCFMNSALQCLSNTFCLTQYFVTGEYKKHINRVNPLGMGGDIAEQYAELVKDLWSGKYRSVAPQDFKWKMEQYAPQFQGSQQHDSQELLGFLLDGMHEDLNKIIDKPFIEAKDHGGRDDNVVAKEYWQNYKARNDSIIVDWFQGQLKNTLHCPECKRYAITFDPFMYLSLALPTIQTVSVRITVVFLDNKKKPIRVSVKVKKSGTVKDAKSEISKMFSIPLDNLIIAEVHDHYIYHFYNDNDDTEDIETGAIYCFEVQSKHHHPVLYPETFGYLLPPPPVKTSDSDDEDDDDDDDFEDFVRVPIVHRKYEIYSYGAHTSRQSARFGVPSFIYVPRNITANQLYHYLVTHFRGQMMRERPLPPRPPRPAPPVPSRPSPPAPVVEPKSSLYSRPSLASRYDSDDDSEKDNKKVYDSDGDSELSDTPFVDDDIEASPAPVAQDSDYEDFVPKDEFDDVEGSAFSNNENDAGGVDSTEKVIVIIDGEEVEIPLEKEDATSTPIVDDTDAEADQNNSNDVDAEADTEKDEEGETSDVNMNSLGDSYDANKSDVEVDVEADDLEGSQEMVDDGDAVDADQDQNQFQDQDQEQDQREQQLKEREQRLQEQAHNPDFSFQDENNHIQFADGYNIDMKLFTIRLTEHTGYRDTDTYYDDDAPLHLRDRQTLLIEWSDDAISRFYDHNKANDFDIHPSYQTTFSSAGNDRLTLDQCLKKFTETETLEADNTWFCSKCQKDMQADKKFDLWRLPRILVIALKRFSYRGRASRDKLDNLVDFPLKDLDLRPYLSGPLEADDPPPIYDLYAVSNHMGGMYGGHYTAYAKNVKKDKWYTFDDSTVSPVSEDRIVSSNAYVLFYARKDIAYDVDNVFGSNSSVEDEKKSDSEEEIIVSDDDDNNNKKNKYGSSSSSSSSTYRHSILSDDDDDFSYSSTLSTYNKPSTVFRDYYDDIDSDDDKKKDSDDEDSEDEKKKKRFDLSAQSTYVAVPVEKTNESANWTSKVSGHDNIADAVCQMRRPPSSDEEDDDSDYYDAR